MSELANGAVVLHTRDSGGRNQMGHERARGTEGGAKGVRSVVNDV